MKIEKIILKRIGEPTVITAIITESREYTEELNWFSIRFHKKGNNYISKNILISNRVHTYLIENKLVISLKSNTLFKTTYIDCILQLTSKSLLEVL
jgi:hypothetical protein